MQHDYPRNTKSLAYGVCAAAVAVLLGAGSMPAEVSAADYRHGDVKGRHAYGCSDLVHYRDVNQAFEKNKRDGQAELDRKISAGYCKMLKQHARVEVVGSRSDLHALHVKVTGEPGDFWINTQEFKHD